MVLCSWLPPSHHVGLVPVPGAWVTGPSKRSQEQTTGMGSAASMLGSVLLLLGE